MSVRVKSINSKLRSSLVISKCLFILLNTKEFSFKEGFDGTSIFDSFVQYISDNKEKEAYTFSFPSIISSGYSVVKEDYDRSKMFKLIKPFILNDTFIDTPKKLLDVIKGDNTDTKLLLWGTDSF